MRSFPTFLPTFLLLFLLFFFLFHSFPGSDYAGNALLAVLVNVARLDGTGSIPDSRDRLFVHALSLVSNILIYLAIITAHKK